MIVLSELEAGKRVMRETEKPAFSKEYDVIVCGLGTAGSPTALFSAENGLRVLGVEAFTCAGGIHAVGGVANHYFGHHGGRYEALDREVAAFAERYTFTQPESRKLLTEQKLIEQGVDILYESTVCGVFLEGNTVIGIRVFTPCGMQDYGAKIVMDCTAEAQVAVMAGCQTECGRPSDGQMQPYSLVSMWFDEGRYRYTNRDFGRVNQNDPQSLSEAILFSGTYEKTKGEQIAVMPLLGLREGRRIIATETVCLADLFAGRQTKTPMFYSYADLDKHGWDIAFEGALFGDWTVGANLGAYNVTVAVPYQAILPKGYEGLLVPCRALGVDHDISSCVRMIPDMKKVAEAAAEWATLALEEGIGLREVAYERLRERLLKSGCLNESHNRGVYIDYKRSDPRPAEKVYWIEDPQKLEERLKTKAPGEAIWSARQIGESAIPFLQDVLQSCDPDLQKHAAFALAALGNGEGIPLLRRMAAERDAVLLEDCRKNNNLRGCMAIYWLGRLADREIVPELIRLINDPLEIEKSVYHQKEIRTTRYAVEEFEDVYFQFMSQAVMALIRIGEAHPDLKAQIVQGFSEAFPSDAYYRRITRRPKESSEGNMVVAMKRIAEKFSK